MIIRVTDATSSCLRNDFHGGLKPSSSLWTNEAFNATPSCISARTLKFLHGSAAAAVSRNACLLAARRVPRS